MKILAGFLKDRMNGVCTEPHVRPFAEYFSGTLMIAEQAVDEIQRIQNIASGKEKPINGYGNSTYMDYSPDLITLDELGSEGEYTCTIKPDQFIRMLSCYYILSTTGESSLMEVEIESYKPYSQEFPIPEEIKKLPLIKLSDPIPLPPGC